MSELASVFSLQMKKSNWVLERENTVNRTNYKKYIINGRDTENLLTKCSDYHTATIFEDALSAKEIKHNITKDILIASLEHIKKNTPEREMVLNMYL